MTKIDINIQNMNNKKIIGNSDKSILKNLHDNYIDWLFMCGGKGRCTTCKVIVCQGLENLSPYSEAEKKYQILGKLKNNERLACQVYAKSDVILRVADENKLPHVNYSE